MGQRHSTSSAVCCEMTEKQQTEYRDGREPAMPHHARLSALHLAIAVGKSAAAQRLLERRQQLRLYLDYRGQTAFGVEIRYSQTVLALAVQFHQWDTFRQLVRCGSVLPGLEQRMLVAGSGRRRSTRDFGNALELLLWALSQTVYCPSHLTECEVLDTLRLTMRCGASPGGLPAQLLHKLCRAALQDILAPYFTGLETSTALHRSALGALKCLSQHGMSLQCRQRACCPGLIGSQLSLYHVLLCFLTDPMGIRELGASRKLRQVMCLLLNAIYGDGVPLPIITLPSLTEPRSRNTALFWYYYGKVKGRPGVTSADVFSVLSAHQSLGRFYTRKPVRLAILARNSVRQRVRESSGGSFSSAVARLPLMHRLRQVVEYMDEKYLDDEIGGILIRMNCCRS